MRRGLFIVLFAPFFFALIYWAGRNPSSTPNPPPVSSDRFQDTDLVSKVKVTVTSPRKSYFIGEPIPITATLTTISSSPIAVFPGCPSQFYSATLSSGAVTTKLELTKPRVGSYSISCSGYYADSHSRPQSQTELLNEYFIVNRPGVVTVQVAHEVDRRDGHGATIHAPPFTIEILPRRNRKR